jgi:O-antigen ligase
VAAFSVYEPMARRFVDLVSLGSNALEGRSFGAREVASAIDLEDRLVIWENGWELFMEEPIFGIGASQFIMRNSHPGGRTIHMHNIFGDVLVNHGVVGFSLFIALLAIWFKKAKGAWQAGLIATLLVSHLFDCFAPYSMMWLVFVAWLVALTTRRPAVMFVKSGSLQPAMSDPGRTDERSVIGQ